MNTVYVSFKPRPKIILKPPPKKDIFSVESRARLQIEKEETHFIKLITYGQRFELDFDIPWPILDDSYPPLEPFAPVPDGVRKYRNVSELVYREIDMRIGIMWKEKADRLLINSL